MSKSQPVTPGRSAVISAAAFDAISASIATLSVFEPGFMFIVVDPADPENPSIIIRANDDVGVMNLGNVSFQSGELGDRPAEPGYPLLYRTATNLYLFDDTEEEWVNLNTLFAGSPSASIFWSGGVTRPAAIGHIAYVANGLPSADASQVSYLGYPVRFPTATRTLRKLSVAILSNTLTTVCEVSVYVNGVKSAMAIDVGIGEVGVLANNVISVPINDGDTVGLSVAMPGGDAGQAITFTAGVGVE